MNPSGSERPRKERLLQMVDLAQVYRGCSKSELASMLDRDPAKIVPDSGNPKLDLVFGLADILDWPVGDVAEALWGRHQSKRYGTESLAVPTGTFAEVDQQARDAHRRGDYRQMLWIGEHMLDRATTPRERACAMTRIAGAWHGEGRFTKSLEWFQAAAAVPMDDSSLSQMLRVNIGFAHLYCWNLIEAQAVATVLLRDLAVAARDDRRSRVALANSHFILGSSVQRSLQVGGLATDVERLSDARNHLLASRDLFRQLFVEFDDPTYAGIANTCEAGSIELEVEAGVSSVDAALSRLLSGLDAVIEPAHVHGDLLESWGWWCVSGLCLALRHLEGEPKQRWAAIFSNKVFELADATGNWALRERAFSLSYMTGALITSDRGVDSGMPLLDRDDVRTLIGTMGRFPRFRSIGWTLLRSALDRTP